MPSKPALLAVLAVAVMLPTSARGADLERGRALYENHCQFCHSVKVHNRQQRWPADLGQLRDIVSQWQAQQNLRWSNEDIDDVIYYLNVTGYNY